MNDPLPLNPHRHALFLDFDGTLTCFVNDPEKVSIPRQVLERLVFLERELGGALAIISGRRVADLDRFLAPLRFAAAGVHGLESRAAPGEPVRTLAGPECLDDIRAVLLRGVAGQAGVKLEDKGTSLVLHYRAAPERQADMQELMRQASAGRPDLKIMAGNHIVEIHPAGMDKGMAVAALMSRLPFVGRQPVYVGDDTTDEFAFAAVEKLGGTGIKVGAGETAASRRLADVAAVHRWLGA